MKKKVYLFENAYSDEIHAFKDHYNVLVYALKKYINDGALRDTIYSAANSGDAKNIVEAVTNDFKDILDSGYLEEVFYLHEVEVEDSDD